MVPENRAGELEREFHDVMGPGLGRVGTEALILVVKKYKALSADV